MSAQNVLVADSVFCHRMTAQKMKRALPVVASGATVLTAQQVVDGVAVALDPAGAAVALTLPTVTLLLAADVATEIGDTFRLEVINTGTTDAAEDITVTAGTGGTLLGAAKIHNSITAEENQSAKTLVVQFNTLTSYQCWLV
jgi:hypothetical protein